MAVAYVKHGRLYYADPGPFEPAVGDQVVIAMEAGERVATVLWSATDVADDVGALPMMTRAAGDHDVQTATDTARRSARARTAARRLVRERNLPMQVLGAEWSASEQRATIWFSAPHRVDFRDLVRSLTAELSMWVLLRQVTERERARLVGGVGMCGRELCCSTFLDAFEPITLQMARDQQLGTDPLKITGACGRLMCCLRYEHPSYVDFTGRPPSKDGSGGCADAGSCGSRAGYDAQHGG